MKIHSSKNQKTQLKLYDTYQRKVLDFNPIQTGKVGLYTCGPTVYDFAHIGNLRTYVFVDNLRRVLHANQYNVNHIMNITDVGHLVSDGDTGEDKMEKGARKQNKSAWDIALFFEEQFFKDLDALNILKPTITCQATKHIQEQIEYIQKIEENGFAYLTQDGVYFDTSKLDKYGYLARLDIAGLQEGARVNAKDKKNITDFALWKFSQPNSKNTTSIIDKPKRQMQWNSPWGVGFPGWHIECSAMAGKYLGELFDIHIGGEDHIPVHHSNEIAQSQACHSTNMANYWMHGYFLQIDNEKVAKSGKSLTLNQLTDKGFDPMAFRYLVLTAHYRKQLNFTWDALQAAQNAIDRLKRFISKTNESGTVSEYYYSRFLGKLNNDINTPQALSILWEVINSDLKDGDKKATLLKFDDLLGLNFNLVTNNLDKKEIPQEIIKLAEQRLMVRSKSNWSQSDELRNRIKLKGFDIIDTKSGYLLKEL